MPTTTEKLHELYNEQKQNPHEGYVQELLLQVALFATESNTLSKMMIRNSLREIIQESENTSKP